MMNGLQALTYWKTYFGNPAGSKQGILNAIQSIGAVCSLPIAPNLADWIGRKYSILIGSLIVVLGAGLQSGARDVGMFIAGRFFSECPCLSHVLWSMNGMLIKELYSRSRIRYQRCRQSSPSHRTRTPKPARKDHCRVQYLLLLWLHNRGLDDVRHAPDPKQLVLATTQPAASRAERTPAPTHFPPARKSSLADSKGPA